MNHFTDVVIIGGGAAGLMCALTAGRRGRRVVVLEKNERVGKKILISGGGRCNFTNIDAGPDNYLSNFPDFCKSALARYTPWDFIAMVNSHGIAFHEKKLGQQFCDGSSRQIVEMLLDECRSVGVQVVTDCHVKSVRRPDRFEVSSEHSTWASHSLVVATGGLSFPNLGATDLGHRIARQFGLQVTALRPALVPLIHMPEYAGWLSSLSGLSLPVEMRQGGVMFAENLLFTHRGISGPAVLQISSYWKDGDTVEINLLPGVSGGNWLNSQRHREGKIENMLSQVWPQRFAAAWANSLDLTKPLSQMSTKQVEQVGKSINAWGVPFQATEGYSKAEATLGGVDVGKISSKTMESRLVPGLFFVGEVLDVTGWLGGYNFQWAWASGNAAGAVA